MHSTLVFGESFSFYFGGMDPSVTLVDLKMTGSAGSLKVIFYDIVKAHIERKGNKIAGKGLVLDTQLNLESTIGQTLFVSANGPTGKCLTPPVMNGHGLEQETSDSDTNSSPTNINTYFKSNSQSKPTVNTLNGT